MAYLGIDVSKNTLDCCLFVNNKEHFFKIDNSKTGFSELLKFIRPHKRKLHVCLESTANYWRPLADFLHKKKYKISVENPVKIFYFAKATLARAKTDKKDAGLIARYCEAMNPRLYEPVPPDILKLKALINILKFFKDKKLSDELKLKDAHPEIKILLKNNLKHWSNQILVINSQLKTFFKQRPELNEQMRRLQTIPAVGFQTAALLLSILSSHQFENSAKFVAFLGLNPRHRESGVSLKGSAHISRIGNPAYRAALYMPAMCAYSHNLYPDFIKNLKDRHKTPKIIVVAIMRKLAVYAFTIFKNSCVFERKT